MVERIRRTAQDTLHVDLNIEDPKAYTKPMTSTMYFQLKPKWDIMEQVCMDNVSFLNFEKNEDVPVK